jgi:hypothetical protein
MMLMKLVQIAASLGYSCFDPGSNGAGELHLKEETTDAGIRLTSNNPLI